MPLRTTIFLVATLGAQGIEQDDQLRPLARILMAQNPTSAFSPGASYQRLPRSRAAQPAMGMSRRDVMNSVAAAGLAAMVGGVLPANAGINSLVSEQDRRNAFGELKPYMERNRDYWAGRLKKLVDKEDWAQLKIDTTSPSKKNKRGGLMTRIPSPMRIWANTGLVSPLGGVQPRQKLANAYIDQIEEAILDLKWAADGEKPGGPLENFGGTVKIAEATRREMAQEAQKRGANAYRKFILVSNEDTPEVANWVPMEPYPEE